MITARNLRKVYGSKVAVDNLSFDVSQGAVTGFLGPNGAGKSTTMRLMLGLDSGEGETLFNGQRFVDLKHPMRYVGAVLDGKAFHPNRTARDHLRMLGAANGIPRGRADQVLEEVGLASVADRRPKGFSLGMGQRLGLAAAILGKPEYLILDEPGNGLDPQGIHWLRDFLREYAAGGRTVFVSSHLLSEMSMMADRLVVIGQGRTLHYGDVKSFVDKFALTEIVVRSPRLAELVGLARSRGATDRPSGDGAAIITNIDPGLIGQLAHAQGIAIHELTVQTPSLEEAFLRATTEAVEYGKSVDLPDQVGEAATSSVSGGTAAESGSNYDPATSATALAAQGITPGAYPDAGVLTPAAQSPNSPVGTSPQSPASAAPLTSSHQMPTQALSTVPALQHRQATSQAAAQVPLAGPKAAVPQTPTANSGHVVTNAPASGPDVAQPMSRARMTSSGSFVIDEDPHDPQLPWSDRIDRNTLTKHVSEENSATGRSAVFDQVAREADQRRRSSLESGGDTATGQQQKLRGSVGSKSVASGPVASDSESSKSEGSEPGSFFDTSARIQSRRHARSGDTTAGRADVHSDSAITGVTAETSGTSGAPVRDSNPQTAVRSVVRGPDTSTRFAAASPETGETTSRRELREARRNMAARTQSRNAPQTGADVVLPDTDLARQQASQLSPRAAQLRDQAGRVQTGRDQAGRDQTGSLPGPQTWRSGAAEQKSFATASGQPGADSTSGPAGQSHSGSQLNPDSQFNAGSSRAERYGSGAGAERADRPWDPLVDPLPPGALDEEETVVFASLQNEKAPRDMPTVSHPVVNSDSTLGAGAAPASSFDPAQRSAARGLAESLAASPEVFSDNSRAGRRRAERRAARQRAESNDGLGADSTSTGSIDSSPAITESRPVVESRSTNRETHTFSPEEFTRKPALRRSGRKRQNQGLDALEVPATSRRDLAAPKPARGDTSDLADVITYGQATARRASAAARHEDRALPRPGEQGDTNTRRSGTA